MKVCFVDGCSGPNNEDPVFFEFPTSRLLRKRWLDAINSSSKVYQEAVVCIRHFGSEDYELVRGKTRLKSKVIPSLGVGEKVENNKKSQSTESETGDKTSHNATSEQETIKLHVHNDNGILHNDNEDNLKVGNGDNEADRNNSHNTPIDTEKTHIDHNSSQKDNENGDNRLYNSENATGDKDKNNEIAQNDNGKCQNKNEKPLSYMEKVQNDIARTLNDIETVQNEIDKVLNDNEKARNDKGKVPNDNGQALNDNGKARNDNGKALNDNGKVQNNKKTRSKITAMRVVNGRRGSSRDSASSGQNSVSSSPPHNAEMEGKEDIEEALTNYYIENKKTERQIAAMADVLEEERREMSEREELWDQRMFEPSEPVFIELSVGQGKATDSQEPVENDCLMVLESVQCDVDPALLLAAREDMDDEIEQVDIGEDDDDEPIVVENKKEDPISLLTSSDEDDVIIQEPKIDTVEVSSADTSEDDMPLVKLVKPPKAGKSKRHKNLLSKYVWGSNDFFCFHCRYTTVDPSEYSKHMATHSKVLQVCQDCGFTTCSKAQMVKHKQKHKNERRFKCKKCNYSAKHEMSLVYHMKTHIGQNEVELAICDSYSPESKKSRLSEKSKASDSDKKHKCKRCGYKTKRRSDLKRHKKALHAGDDDEENDDDYVP